MKVYNVDELPHTKLISSKTLEEFSSSCVLTDLLQFSHLFVHHEILLPGKRASSPHCHTKQEELFFVLEGCPTVYEGTKSMQLKPGDYVSFTPGTGQLHYIENRTSETVKLLAICSKRSDDEVLYQVTEN